MAVDIEGSVIQEKAPPDWCVTPPDWCVIHLTNAKKIKHFFVTLGLLENNVVCDSGNGVMKSCFHFEGTKMARA